MPANVDSMAYYGDVPWHGLGTRVEKGISSEQMIKAAGLDWNVEKRAARGASIDKKGRAARYEMVRMPRNEQEEEVLLGVVSRRYEPLQNAEAFAFFDPIVERGKSYFETAGALGDGERVWVLATMPDVIEVVRGDECMKYLLLSNTHSGQGSVIVKFTAVRVVCQNTLMLSMEDGQPTLRVRHSKIMNERLSEASEVIAAASKVYAEAAELFRRMAQLSLKRAQLHEYLELVMPRSSKQRCAARRANTPSGGHM